jgi:predicted nucleotidyltransferase
MTSLTEASLSREERALLGRFAQELRARMGDELDGVWLFGSRARGERPQEDSDVDVLVLVADESWQGKLRVHAALDAAARKLDLQAPALSFSVHIHTPAWLEQRRRIRSFFIAEVDRDKIAVGGGA